MKFEQIMENWRKNLLTEEFWQADEIIGALDLNPADIPPYIEMAANILYQMQQNDNEFNFGSNARFIGFVFVGDERNLGTDKDILTGEGFDCVIWGQKMFEFMHRADEELELNLDIKNKIKLKPVFLPITTMIYKDVLADAGRLRQMRYGKFGQHNFLQYKDFELNADNVKLIVHASDSGYIDYDHSIREFINKIIRITYRRGVPLPQQIKNSPTDFNTLVNVWYFLDDLRRHWPQFTEIEEKYSESLETYEDNHIYYDPDDPEGFDSNDYELLNKLAQPMLKVGQQSSTLILLYRKIIQTIGGPK